jgi:hypothetical protein
LHSFFVPDTGNPECENLFFAKCPERDLPLREQLFGMMRKKRFSHSYSPGIVAPAGVELKRNWALKAQGDAKPDVVTTIQPTKRIKKSPVCIPQSQRGSAGWENNLRAESAGHTKPRATPWVWNQQKISSPERAPHKIVSK